MASLIGRWVCTHHGTLCDAVSQTTENRFFYLKEYDIRISYFGFWKTAQGHYPIGWREGTKLTPQTYGFKDFHWQGDLPYLADVIQKAFGTVDEVGRAVFRTGC